MSAGIFAIGAVSPMGEGWDAVSAGRPGEVASVLIMRDDQLAQAGFLRPHAARVGPRVQRGDHATSMLVDAGTACARELDASFEGWRELRVGLAVGTSSGAMRTAEVLFDLRSRSDALVPNDTSRGAVYFAPLVALARVLGMNFEPATLVMGACAASTLAVGLGLRWIESDACDVVLAGGFDAISTFVAAGFESLRATSAEIPPRPFRAGRDGMALGEGAAIVALARPRRCPAFAYVTGFAASSDAVHVTAPDRTGKGLATAASKALLEAGVCRPDLVSPHGSATPFSDAAEVRALSAVLGDESKHVVIHPLKAQIGHTLGAAGVLELLACVDALRRGVYPAAAGFGEFDPGARLRLLEVAERGHPRTAMKLSAAFGGANAALVVDKEPRAERSGGRAVYIGRAVQVARLPALADLALGAGAALDKLARTDTFARWTISAVSALAAQEGALSGAGIIVGSAFATIETNALFFARIRERGVRAAEPRRFPYTSPNAAGGEAGVLFGLTGPAFGVGCGLHAAVEAVVAAARLVERGDAADMVVVAVDDVGDVVRSVAPAFSVEIEAGAIALRLSRRPFVGSTRLTSFSSGIGPRSARGAPARGHHALAPLVGGDRPGPTIVEAWSPDAGDGRAQAHAWARFEVGPRN